MLTPRRPHELSTRLAAHRIRPSTRMPAEPGPPSVSPKYLAARDHNTCRPRRCPTSTVLQPSNNSSLSPLQAHTPPCSLTATFHPILKNAQRPSRPLPKCSMHARHTNTSCKSSISCSQQQLFSIALLTAPSPPLLLPQLSHLRPRLQMPPRSPLPPLSARPILRLSQPRFLRPTHLCQRQVHISTARQPLLLQRRRT